MTHHFSPDQIKAQVLRIVQSKIFIKSKRLQGFLEFIVERVLENKQHLIKQQTIAMNVFGYGRDFNSQINPIIRIQANRLRKALASYYNEIGVEDEIIITIPKGAYIPHFESRQEKLQQELSSIHESNVLLTLKDHPIENTTNSPLSSSYFYTKLIVLPFENCSQDSNNDYFADALGELITTELSYFPEISVISYFSSQKYKNAYHNLSILEEELGVKYVLSGRVHHFNEKLLIFVYLINTENHEQIWSDKFIFSLENSNYLAIQDKIIKKTLSIICSPFGYLQQACSQDQHLNNISSGQVFEAILRSHCSWLNPSYENFIAAYKVLSKVISNNSLNHSFLLSMLAQHSFDAEVFGYLKIEKAFQQGIDYAQKAVSLNQNCQYAYHAYAYAYLIQKQPQKVISSASKIRDINPYNAFMLGLSGWWMSLAGEFKQGLSWLVESMELNPYYPSWFHFAFYLNHFQKQQYEQALVAADKFFVPSFFWSYILKYAAFYKLGDLESAKLNLTKTLELNPNFSENPQYYLNHFIILDDCFSEVLDISYSLI